MQYAVPQFTDVEDRLIGFLTLRQFLVVLFFGGLDLMFWSLFKLSLFFFLFALPITLLGAFLAFGTFNGRPVLNYTVSFIVFFRRPQVRIFKREEPVVFMQKIKTESKPKKADVLEEPGSRLKKLAYLLDQKVQEEQELIEKRHG